MLHELEHPCPLTIISETRLNVRFWHKADITRLSSNVCFWGMSAFDPKRTFSPIPLGANHCCNHLHLSLNRRGPKPRGADDATARVYIASRRRGDSMVGQSAGPAGRGYAAHRC